MAICAAARGGESERGGEREGEGTHGDDGADEEGVVVAQDEVVRAPEARVELGGGVGLRVLERVAGEREAAAGRGRERGCEAVARGREESPGEADEGGGGDALVVAGLCGDEGLEGGGVGGAGRVARPDALRRATNYVSAREAGCDAGGGGGGGRTHGDVVSEVRLDKGKDAAAEEIWFAGARGGSISGSRGEMTGGRIEGEEGSY